MEKQIAKAERKVEKNSEEKRTKFLKSKDNRKESKKNKQGKKEKLYKINTTLIEKTKLLLGIKGYYTNLPEEKADNQTIITRYHNLWHVEKAFRIAKNDLAMRPIYHFKRETIEAHILICFMALVTSKYMEQTTGQSIRRILQLLGSISEARMKNKLTGEIFVMRKALTEEVEDLWKTLSL